MGRDVPECVAVSPVEPSNISEPPPSAPGRSKRSVGPYQLLRKLGQGGMSSVYLAKMSETSQSECEQGGDVAATPPVALKLLTLSLEDEPEFVERFRREAELTQKLSHPSIVPTLEFGEDPENGLYLTMPYIQGGNLRQLIHNWQQSAALPPDENLRPPIIELAPCLDWLSQTTSALDYAHRLGVIHRDLKPENILLDEKKQALIADFGVARVDAATKLTRTGLMPGTPEYMSPELFGDEAASPASDVYSLALVFYELLTGVAPFRCDNVAKTIQRQAYEAPPLLSDTLKKQQLPELPLGLDPVFSKALEKDPAKRFPTAQGFFLEFQKALTAGQSTPSKLIETGRIEVASVSQVVASPSLDSVTSGSQPRTGESGVNPTMMVNWTQRSEKPKPSWMWWLLPTGLVLLSVWLNWQAIKRPAHEELWRKEATGFGLAPLAGRNQGCLFWEGLEVCYFPSFQEQTGLDQARIASNRLSGWLRQAKLESSNTLRGQLSKDDYVIMGPEELVRISTSSARDLGAKPTQVGTYWLAILKDIVEMRDGSSPKFVKAHERDNPLRANSVAPLAPQLDRWFEQARILKKEGPLVGDSLPRALLGLDADERRRLTQMARYIPVPVPKQKS
jgi:serine/threonine protein kinase